MHLKRILIILVAIIASTSLAFALTYTSSNYTLTGARIVVSGGKAIANGLVPSWCKTLNDVAIGNVFGGKAQSTNYSLDASNINITDQGTAPNSPTLNPITTPTNIPIQTLSGTKDPNTSIYINGYEVVPLNSETTWSYDYALDEGENNLIITSRNSANLESEAVYGIIILDTIPPEILITSPPQGTVFHIQQITLEGTIDGVNFSETRILTSEGKHVLTKTAEDEAGNTGSSCVTVYYYQDPGAFIGPEGGELSSPDGRVKVIIPAGALSEYAYIRLIPLDEEPLRRSLPEDYTLLTIVECKPYELNFNLPVELIYTLDTAEVPGTPIELGLYDSEEGEIILTGETSLVDTDSYTVNFAITHFSTYAALRGSGPGDGAAIGAWTQIPLPDMFTGAFSHAIPITVPPGRKNMQPNLQLLYKSSHPNSWVGVGFSLNPGYIVRSTRLGPPTYIDTEDTFYLVTAAGTTELVHLLDNLYQARIESDFTKFFKESDDSWRVAQKDGTTLYFGQTEAAKETGSGGIFSWYLTKVIDTNTNYVQYNYTQDQGKTYLSLIEYTGNENTDFAPRHRVEFSLEEEPREDVFSSYLSGAKISTAKRLSEIQVKINSALVWRYNLEYIYSQDTCRSLLRTITQHSSDGEVLPTQTFNYQSANAQ